MKKSRNNNQDGQALITLVFFIVIALTIITASVAILFTNSLATSATEQGIVAYYAAESGAEDGILRLLREPTFTGTYQPFTTGQAQASVTIASDGTITSTGTFSNSSLRKILVRTVYTNGVRTISSWEEIPQ